MRKGAAALLPGVLGDRFPQSLLEAVSEFGVELGDGFGGDDVTAKSKDEVEPVCTRTRFHGSRQMFAAF